MNSRGLLFVFALATGGCNDELSVLRFGAPGEEKSASVRVNAGDNIELWNDIHIVREGNGESAIFWEIHPSLNGSALPELKCDPYLSNYCTSKSDGAGGKDYENCFVEDCELEIGQAGELEIRAKIIGNGTGGKFVKKHVLRIKRD